MSFNLTPDLSPLEISGCYMWPPSAEMSCLNSLDQLCLTKYYNFANETVTGWKDTAITFLDSLTRSLELETEKTETKTTNPFSLRSDSQKTYTRVGRSLQEEISFYESSGIAIWQKGKWT